MFCEDLVCTSHVVSDTVQTIASSSIPEVNVMVTGAREVASAVAQITATIALALTEAATATVRIKTLAAHLDVSLCDISFSSSMERKAVPPCTWYGLTSNSWS